MIAAIVLAAWKLARLTDAGDARLWTISIVIGVLTAVTGTEVALLIVAGGLVILIWDAPPGTQWRGAAIPLGLPGQLRPLLGALVSASILLALLYWRRPEATEAPRNAMGKVLKRELRDGLLLPGDTLSHVQAELSLSR